MKLLYTALLTLIAGVVAAPAGLFNQARPDPSLAYSVSFDGRTFINQGLVAFSRIPSDAKDKYGETIGGIGSAIKMDLTTWRPMLNGSFQGVLHMVPDRGYNVYGTTDYRPRVHLFNAVLTPYNGVGPYNGSAPQQQLSLTYKDTILLHERNGTYGTGLDPTSIRPAQNGFPELPVAGGEITQDTEGIVLDSPFGIPTGSFWTSDEYYPAVYHYTADGTLLSAIRPPDAYIPLRNGTESFSADSPPVGSTVEPIPADPTDGRSNNKGFEGLAISGDGKTLYVLLQSALVQDGGLTKANAGNTRLLEYDISNAAKPVYTHEYTLTLPSFIDPTKKKGGQTIAAQSEMHYVDPSSFMVLARDSGHGYAQSDGTSIYRKIALYSTNNATDLKQTPAYDAFNGTIAPGGTLLPGITPSTHVDFIDFNNVTQLARFGLNNGPDTKNPNDLNEKWESITIVPCFDIHNRDDYFLIAANDNDFITQTGVYRDRTGVLHTYSDPSGFNVDTQVLVWRVTLPGYKGPLLNL